MAWTAPLQARWNALAAREQKGLKAATLIVLLAATWAVLVAPALRTLQGAALQRTALSAELERMQALQVRATQLRAKPSVTAQDAGLALQAAALALGKSAHMQLQGEQATLTLTQVDAATLAPWLSPAGGSGLNPSEVHLRRDPALPEGRWNGTLVFRLPNAAASAP